MLPTKKQYPLSYKYRVSIELPVSRYEDRENLIMHFNYVFPETIKKCYAFSFNWNIAILLSMFRNLRMLLKLLTAILLERSVIFISNSETKLSAAVLGFKALIKPFSWCHTLIPVIPGNLIEMLDSPFPLLVGVTTESYQQMLEDYDLDSEYRESKTWVFLDKDL